MNSQGKSVLLALVLAVVLSALICGGLQALRAPAPAETDVSGLGQEIARATEAITALSQRLDAMERQILAAASRPVEARAEQPAAVAAPEPQPGLSVRDLGELRDLVLTVLEEDRQLQRDESRQRQEDRQERLDALRDGPYGNLNLKVNSMAEVLGLDQVQKDRYFDIHTAYTEKAAKSREGIDWRDRESRQAAMETYRSMEEDFAADVKAILTPEQVETYDALPPMSRSLVNPGYVAPPGQEGEAIRTNLQELLRGGLQNMRRR